MSTGGRSSREELDRGDGGGWGSAGLKEAGRKRMQRVAHTRATSPSRRIGAGGMVLYCRAGPVHRFSSGLVVARHRGGRAGEDMAIVMCTWMRCRRRTGQSPPRAPRVGTLPGEVKIDMMPISCLKACLDGATLGTWRWAFALARPAFPTPRPRPLHTHTQCTPASGTTRVPAAKLRAVLQ